MAYLDGEATATSHAEMKAHLAACETCRAIAADLRGVSGQARTWSVTAAPASLHTPNVGRKRAHQHSVHVVAAVTRGDRQPRTRRRSRARDLGQRRAGQARAVGSHGRSHGRTGEVTGREGWRARRSRRGRRGNPASATAGGTDRRLRARFAQFGAADRQPPADRWSFAPPRCESSSRSSATSARPWKASSRRPAASSITSQ